MDLTDSLPPGTLERGNGKEGFESHDIDALHTLVSCFAQPLLTRPQPALWAVVPKVSGPTCSLDTILLDIIDMGLQAPASDIAYECSSSIADNIAAVLGPSAAAATQLPVCSAVTKQICDLWGRSLASDFPELVAVLYTIYAIVRWQVLPNQKNYERIPSWLRPVPIQLHKAHPVWMDCLPWPVARSKLVESFDNLRFDEFSKLCVASMSVNLSAAACWCRRRIRRSGWR